MLTADAIFRGVTVSLTTPFDKNGDYDSTVMGQKLDYIINSGINGALLATGSIGECFALSVQERIEIWKTSIDHINNRAPFIAGTNHTSTRIACELAEKAEQVGAAAILNLSPYYWKLDEEAIYRHYKALREATSLPILIYNNPGVTGVDLPVSALTRLSKLGNVGLKECTLDMVKLESVVRGLKGKVPILHGRNELHAPYGHFIGTDGLTSGPANWCAEIVKKLCDYQNEGKLKEALDLRQRGITPVFESFAGLSVHQTIEAYKFVESVVNIPVGAARPPAYELSEDRKAKIKNVIQQIGLKKMLTDCSSTQ